MLSAAIEVVIEAIASAIGWVMRILRGGVVDAVLAGSEPSAETLRQGGRAERRRMRKHLKSLASAGDFDELIAVYRRLGRGEEFRDLRIDALITLASAAPDRAEPLLRECIEGADDAYVVFRALDLAAKHRMIGLLNCVDEARDDHRPLVAQLAQDVHRRLTKAARKTTRAAAELPL